MSEAIGVDSPSKKGKKDFHEYEIDDALHTLQRAEEIKGNEHLMKHVHKHAKKKIKEIRSIADLKKVRQEKADEENSKDE